MQYNVILSHCVIQRNTFILNGKNFLHATKGIENGSEASTKIRDIAGGAFIREEICVYSRGRLSGYLIFIHPPQIFSQQTSTFDAPSLTSLLSSLFPYLLLSPPSHSLILLFLYVCTVSLYKYSSL